MNYPKFPIMFINIKQIIKDQREILRYIFDKFKTKLLYLKCRISEVNVVKINSGAGNQNVECTFLMPHKNCAEYAKLCLESIEKFANKTNYRIMIADDFSNMDEFMKLRDMANPKTSIYRFTRKAAGHPFVLEWLYLKAKSDYVIILDQDSILISDYWEKLLDEFNNNKKLILIGIRDSCAIRKSPQMVHPSFILINKQRCDKALRPPLFFGDRPFYHRYSIGLAEPQHALSCKALAFDPQSIQYLDTYQTKYGFGTVGYYKNINQRVVYHQWYSGRIYKMDDNDDILNGVLVKDLKKGISKYLDDNKTNGVDLEPVYHHAKIPMFNEQRA